MRSTIVFIFIFLSFNALSSYEDYKFQHNPIEHPINSHSLETVKNIWVMLPEGYNHDTNKAKSYPVIYITDGENHQYLAGASAWFASRMGLMPQAIIVAIDTTQNRSKDLTPSTPKNHPHFNESNTGNSHNLESFIIGEAIPFIDDNYRTNEFRVLAGHSFGGLFTLNSLLSSEIRAYFNSFVAIDPSLWWDDQVMTNRFDKAGEEFVSKQASVFIIAAHEKNVPKEHQALYKAHINGIEDVVDHLDDVDLLNVNYQITHDEHHGSILYTGFYKGLRSAFDCYQKACKKPDEDNELDD